MYMKSGILWRNLRSAPLQLIPRKSLRTVDWMMRSWPSTLYR